MTDIAKYLRIFNPDPNDDYAQKRSEAIKSINAAFTKKNGLNDLMALANGLAIGLQRPMDLDPYIRDIVEKALQEQSASFVADGEDLQILCCALVAILIYLTEVPRNGQAKMTIQDVFGISLWSGLSFQSSIKEMPKLEMLKEDIIRASKDVIDSSSYSSRARLEVPLPNISISDPNGNWNELAKNLNKTLSNIIEPMKTNATLDREEIDLLWWTLDDWSEIAQMKISKLNGVQRAIIGSLELANMLRRVPSKSIYSLALRSFHGEHEFSSKEVLKEMGDLLRPIQSILNSKPQIGKYSSIFPLFTLLTTESVLNNASGKAKRSINEWCGRTLLEGTMLNFEKFLNDGR